MKNQKIIPFKKRSNASFHRSSEQYRIQNESLRNNINKLSQKILKLEQIVQRNESLNKRQNILKHEFSQKNSEFDDQPKLPKTISHNNFSFFKKNQSDIQRQKKKATQESYRSKSQQNYKNSKYQHSFHQKFGERKYNCFQYNSDYSNSQSEFQDQIDIRPQFPSNNLSVIRYPNYGHTNQLYFWNQYYSSNVHQAPSFLATANLIQNQNRCKAVGCFQNHLKHYCRFCKDDNSNHLSSNCNLNPNKRTMVCKVKNCRQNHFNHVCNTCPNGNNDSDHFQKYCPHNKITKRCKIRDCDINHDKHFCKICRANDADHHAKDCLQGMLVYHGTTEERAKLIQKNYQLKPSTSGNLGAGIYFTPNKDAAIGIAQYRFNQTKERGIIFHAIIPKDKNCYKQKTHGPWKGAYEHNFQQICVPNDSRIRIIKWQNI